LSGKRQAWIIVSICGALALAILLLIMTMLERLIAEWSAPQPASPDNIAVRRSQSPDQSGHPVAACSSTAEWITSDDYPAEAIRAEHEGTTRVAWTIGDDGRVSSCRVVESSGHDSLDRAGCQAILARGCYDRVRLPEARSQTRRIVWRLPE
jgi:protein TonB